MLNIIKICGAAILSVILSEILKNRSSSLSSYLTSITSVTLLITALTSISPIITYIKTLIHGGKSGSDVIGTLMASLSIAILCQTVCDICRDHGANTLSTVVEFAGNSQIVLLSLPLIKGILDTAFEALKL